MDTHLYLRLRARITQFPLMRKISRSRVYPAGVILRRIDKTMLRFLPTDARVRHKFDTWALTGAAENMEQDHLWFTEATIQKMKVVTGDRILDLGCGEGWASRLMGRSGAQILGLDLSNEMIRRAQRKAADCKTITFLCGSAESIPCPDECFTKVLSVSAFYYFSDPRRVLRELYRVVAPGGQLFLLTALYKELTDWRASAHDLQVPVHVCSASEYKSMLESAGWVDAKVEELTAPQDHTNGHSRALLIAARKAVPEGYALADSRSSSARRPEV